MTTGLFIRSYPAPGAQPISVTYNVGLYAYFVVCLLPVVVTCRLVVVMFESGKSDWLIPALVVSILTIFLAVLFLRALRLEISADGISYANPVRGRRSLTFPEMSSVVLIDYRHEGNGVASINRSLRLWTLVITPRVDTGKPTLKIPLTVFPRSAYNEIMVLLKPEIWESNAP